MDFDDAATITPKVTIKQVMYGTGLGLDEISARIDSSEVNYQDTGYKILYYVDDDFLNIFPEFDLRRAKQGDYKRFAEKKLADDPLLYDDGDHASELDFSGDNGISYDNSRYKPDVGRQLADMLKREIPEKLLTREEEEALGKGMKLDMGAIVPILFRDMSRVVSMYLRAISPQGDDTYFRTLLPEDGVYEMEEGEGYPPKGSAADIFSYFNNKIRDKDLENILNGQTMPVKRLTQADLDPQYVQYVYNNISRARQSIKNMGNKQKSQAARKIGFKDYRDMETKMSRLDRFMESYVYRRNYFIEHNMRLIFKIAGRFRYRGMEFLDLVQEGSLGVERAAVKFDYRRKNKFSTYAIIWIKQTMYRAIEDQTRTIRIPMHLWPLINLTRDQLTDFQAYNDRQPTLDELLRSVNREIRKKDKKKQIKMDRLKSLMPYLDNEIRLDAPLQNADGDSDVTLRDTIECTDYISPEEYVMSAENGLILSDILKEFTPKEEKILRMRFGIDKDDESTLQECGDEFEVTRERIRQIEAYALKKSPQVLKNYFGFRTLKELRKARKQGRI